MLDSVLVKIGELGRGKWRKTLIVLAAIVVFITAYALTMPATTWQRTVVCDQVEHVHEAQCFEEAYVLTCEDKKHQHDEDCFVKTQVPTDNDLETLVLEHEHDKDCYKTVTVLDCDSKEEEHVHDEDCYKKVKALVCPEAEKINKGKIEKKIDELEDELKDADEDKSALLASEIEFLKAKDTEVIYVLECDKKEHIHTDECFDAPPKEDEGYTCGEIEHQHSEEQFCYFPDGSLRCTLTEHTHDDSCKPEEEEKEQAEASKDEKNDAAEKAEAVSPEEEMIEEKEYDFKVEAETEDGIKVTVAGMDKALAGDSEGLQLSAESVIDENTLEEVKGISEDQKLELNDRKLLNVTLTDSSNNEVEIKDDVAIQVEGYDSEGADIYTVDTEDKELTPLETSSSKKALTASTGSLGMMLLAANGDTTTTYYKKVDKIESGKTYIIVSDTSKYALTNGTPNATELSFPSAENGVYALKGIDETMKWTFTSSGTGSYNIKNGNSYINLGWSNKQSVVLSTESRDLKVEYVDSTKMAWLIGRADNNSYYLKEQDGSVGFTRGASSNRYVYIMEEVTAQQEDPTPSEYYQKVSNIEAGKPYIIVSSTTGKLLKADSSTTHYGVDIGNPVGDKYYPSGVDATMEWQFGKDISTSDSTTILNESTGQYLYLKGNSNSIFPGDSGNMTLSYQNGSWLISRTGYGNTYYLNDNNGFAKSTSSGTPVYIMEKVTEGPDQPVTTYETTKSGSNDNTKYTINVYGLKVDDKGKKVGEPVFLGTQVINNEYIHPEDLPSNKNTRENSKMYIPENMFAEYQKAGAIGKGYYYSAYYGTTNTKDVDNVSNIYWDTRTLYVDGSSSKSYSASNGNAIYLEYVEGRDPKWGPESYDDKEKVPTHYKRIDAFRDDFNNPDTDLDDNLKKAGTDLFDYYRLYLDVGPEAAFDDLDIVFIMDSSTSMSGFTGFDAKDINGNDAWRCWALDTLMNGENADTVAPGKSTTDNSKQHQTALVENGLLYRIAALNPDNKIAVARFSPTSEILLPWSSSSDVHAIKYSNVQGTNYVAGLQEARDFFQDPKVINDGNKKVLIFISDGFPTKYYNHLKDDATTTTPGGSGQEGAREQAVTARAIGEFKTLFQDKIATGEMEIFTIGVGTWDTVLLEQLSTSGTSFNSTNFQEIYQKLDNMITRGAGRYLNLKIQDTLSEDVDFYSADLDVVVKRIRESTGEETILYEKGARTTPGESYIKENGVNINGKTISVEFLDNFEEEGGYRYSLSFNVKTTQTAYNKYVENAKKTTDKSGYIDSDKNSIYGEVDTDYSYQGTYNETSSDKLGFYSNDNENTFLEYTQKFSTWQKDYTAPFIKPVVQVRTTEVPVEKIWSDDPNGTLGIHDNDTVTVQLTGKLEGSPDITKTATFGRDDDWKYTFDNLPYNYTYTVEEIEVPQFYKASKRFDETTGTWIFTNTKKNKDILVTKKWTDDPDGSKNIHDDDAVTITLYQNGEKYIDEDYPNEYSIILNNANNWEGSFESIPINDEDGEAYEYTVVESGADGYIATYGEEQATTKADGTIEYSIEIVNTPGEELPYTGGPGTTLIYALGILLIAVGGTYLVRYRRRERRAN